MNQVTSSSECFLHLGVTAAGTGQAKRELYDWYHILPQ